MNNQKNKKISLFSFIIFGFCIATLIYAFSLGINGNDFWWHLKAGDWILSHKQIPTHDIFSWYASSNNYYWFSHEWLSEVLLSLIFSIGGTIGIFLFSLCIAITILVLFFFAAGENFDSNPILSTIYTLIFVCIVYIYCYGRPQLFTYLLLNITYIILYRFKKNSSSKSICFLPVISIIWANIHGGSSNLAYLLPIILLLSMTLNFKFGKIEFNRSSKTNIVKLSIITLISIICICVNPHGVSMFTYPYTNMSDKLMLKLISEWAAPDAKDLAQLFFFFVPIIGVTILFIATDKKIDGFDFLNYVFFAYLFFRSTRFIIFFMIVSAFYAFKYMIPSKKSINFDGKKEEKFMIGFLFGLCLIFSIFGFINMKTTYNSKKGLIKKVLSKETINYVKKDNPKKLFNDYNFGETLIYNNIPVFIDSRADVYKGDMIKDYTCLRFSSYANKKYNKKTYIDEIINKYNFDAFLIEPTSALLPYLYSHSDKYEIKFENNEAVYVKAK
ncbi:hypothetical protein SAMN02745111_01286 [Eubacterium uniforme]|uniref:Dolichyl-phosphate-mannose-protein mannosyltransferase n=1 Tax=Eubacterium uniforme TaxID=39495 RepID=A0A1T4VN29_9FIRM|nr:hypothetical protein [Eubacterium uniforme]SKA66336.1 hypothetical protein SAMN02745111_01286 [Eubacterium uniforme]